MEANAKKFATVDEYIGGFPTAVKRILKQIRKTIKEAAPGAEELISYNMLLSNFMEHWFIMPHTRCILDFILPLRR